MNKFLILLLLSLSYASFYAQDKATLTDAKVSFTFVSKNVKGTLTGFRSTSTIDTNDLTNSTFKGSVQAKTIESGNFLRNWSLRGGKYFDADNYPKLTFESTSITPTENGFIVEGRLTIKETTKTISIAFKKEGDRLMGTTTLFSSDFGINIIKKSREANKVNVNLSFKIG